MKVLVIISRDLQKPSTWFRIRQFEPLFNGAGIELDYRRKEEFKGSGPLDFRGYDWVINQKCQIPLGVSKRIFREAQRTWYDYDDAVYTRPGGGHSVLTAIRVGMRLRYWLRHSNVVTTANHTLAKYASRCRETVHVIPMAVDLDNWKPTAKPSNRHVVLGWIGSPATLSNIERLAKPLSELLKKNSHAKLRIFCGKRPDLPFDFDYVAFEPGTEAEFVRSLDVGLLPMIDDPFYHGKSPIKAIQYLACEVPVVGNIYGATAEILNAENSVAVESETQWETVLADLIRQPDKMKRLGESGRRFIEHHHGLHTVAKRLIGLLQCKEVTAV